MNCYSGYLQLRDAQHTLSSRTISVLRSKTLHPPPYPHAWLKPGLVEVGHAITIASQRFSTILKWSYELREPPRLDVPQQFLVSCWFGEH